MPTNLRKSSASLERMEYNQEGTRGEITAGGNLVGGKGKINTKEFIKSQNSSSNKQTNKMTEIQNRILISGDTWHPPRFL